MGDGRLRETERLDEMADADRLPSLVASAFTIRTRAGSPSALNRSAVASASSSDNVAA